MTTNRHTALISLLVLALAGASVPAHASLTDGADYGYGYYRTVEGTALLTGLEKDAEPIEVEPNYPVLTGDRLWVERDSRVEIVLPDRVVVRLDAGTELFFESLSGSADAADDATTVLGLLEGEIHVVGRGELPAGSELDVITSNGRIFLQLPGEYRIGSNGRDWTEVAVREGFAELNTEYGSAIARPGEDGLIEGTSRPQVTIAQASTMSELELWGAALTGEELPSSNYVDDSLAYAAAPLEESGEWVSTSGRSAWRPRVRVGWRPFSDGWWVHTPSGLSWVAYERWGWVTSHYGAWDYVPGYGWLWFPGTTYSPAWVYWYWGPTHSAWVPSGYYTRHYRGGFDAGFRFGVYGWAGGSWNAWAHWTFCPTRYFGRKNYRSYWRSGYDMRRDQRLRAVPRGLITTDTRDLHPRHWGKPSEIVQVLERRHGRDTRSGGRLTDVTPFVERRTSLPEDVRRVVGGTRSTPPSPERRYDGPQTPATRGATPRTGPPKTASDPWQVRRPDTVSGRSVREDAPRPVARRGGARATDWELIERLRRFENKEEGLPASPRTRSDAGPGGSRGYIPPKPEVPTRRIVEDMRSRGARPAPPAKPQAAPRSPTAQPQSGRRPPTTSGSRSSGSTPRARPSGSAPRSAPRSSGTVSKPKPSSKSTAKPRSGSSSRSRPRKKSG